VELTKLGITIVRNELFPSNTYLLKSDRSSDCLVIDPGLDAKKILNKIDELGLKPIAILATHGHFDHIATVSEIKEKFQIPFFMHESDVKLSQSANFYLKLTKINYKITTPSPDYLFKSKKEELTLGDFRLTVYNFPGHSNGSCIIQCHDLLFSGDIVYKKGLGFNNFPGENLSKLKTSIKEVFDSFPQNSIALPGHGEPEYLNKIRSNNTELIAFLNQNALQ